MSGNASPALEITELAEDHTEAFGKREALPGGSLRGRVVAPEDHVYIRMCQRQHEMGSPHERTLG